jgi:hypothetical protein
LWLDFGEHDSGNEKSETRNENSATREKLLQLEMDLRNIYIHQVKNDQYFYCVHFYYFMLSDALYISLHFLYMKAIELQDLFSFDCGLGDTSKRTGLCIVIQGVKTIFYTDLNT